jgi:hypothetical protein
MWFLQVRISCLNVSESGYEIEDSGHDISFTLTNGVYTLGELFGEIGILRNFPTPRIPALTPRLGVCMTFLR